MSHSCVSGTSSRSRPSGEAISGTEWMTRSSRESCARITSDSHTRRRGEMLSHENSADFVTKIRPSTNTDKYIVSFDVKDHFTNVLLKCTTNCIFNHMYPGCDKTKRSVRRLPFDGKVYEQHSGVAMGASLAPVTADIFMAQL